MVCYQVNRAVAQAMKTVEVPTLIYVTCEGTRCFVRFWVALEIEWGKRILLQIEKCCYLPNHFLLQTKQDVNDDDSNMHEMTHNM